jgi:hypothetical protein
MPFTQCVPCVAVEWGCVATAVTCSLARAYRLASGVRRAGIVLGAGGLLRRAIASRIICLGPLATSNAPPYFTLINIFSRDLSGYAH